MEERGKVYTPNTHFLLYWLGTVIFQWYNRKMEERGKVYTPNTPFLLYWLGTDTLRHMAGLR
jgi:hypothetical protein